MGLFSRKKPAKSSIPGPVVPASTKTTAQWQQWEMARGCVSCGKKGCHRMNHSYFVCVCGSPYCNGDGCPGPRRRR